MEANSELRGPVANGNPAGDGAALHDPAERLGGRRKVSVKRPGRSHGREVPDDGANDDVPYSPAGAPSPGRSVIPEGFAECVRTVELDGEFSSKYPGLWDCLTKQQQSNGDKRAPGELRLFADGAVFVVSLTLPEEGASMAVTCPNLTDSLSALEEALWSENPPWRKASKYAIKKKLGKPKKG